MKRVVLIFLAFGLHQVVSADTEKLGIDEAKDPDPLRNHKELKLQISEGTLKVDDGIAVLDQIQNNSKILDIVKALENSEQEEWRVQEEASPKIFGAKRVMTMTSYFLSTKTVFPQCVKSAVTTVFCNGRKRRKRLARIP